MIKGEYFLLAKTMFDQHEKVTKNATSSPQASSRYYRSKKRANDNNRLWERRRYK